jgi:hypothetical protein
MPGAGDRFTDRIAGPWSDRSGNALIMLICAYPYHQLIFSTPSRIEVDGTPWRVAMSNARPRDRALGASVALDGDRHIGRRGTLVTLLNYLDTAFRTNSTHSNITLNILNLLYRGQHTAVPVRLEYVMIGEIMEMRLAGTF